MLKKNYSKTGEKCRVTFKLAKLEAERAALVGEFNDWDAERDPMKQLKDGSYSVTVSLDAGQAYRFRYLVDGKRWVNDEAPDDLVLNRFGDQDCVINV